MVNSQTRYKLGSHVTAKETDQHPATLGVILNELRKNCLLSFQKFFKAKVNFIFGENEQGVHG